MVGEMAGEMMAGEMTAGTEMMAGEEGTLADEDIKYLTRPSSSHMLAFCDYIARCQCPESSTLLGDRRLEDGRAS